MCLYDLQYPVIYLSLQECVRTSTSSVLVCGQDDKITTVFAKDVGEFHGTPQG